MIGNAVEIRGLSKCFRFYDRQYKRILEILSSRKYHKEYWALQDINLNIAKGEAVGIIGPNGAGKSTLLKILCGSLHCTQGEYIVSGRILSLLELGTGFHPDLSGMDNIFNSASMQGFPIATIKEKLDEIIAFADIGSYIYNPVKTYSSGMYVRLAFAMYACLDPDIYIVDEALSVGDVFFQQKCYERLKKMKEEGVTILMVSHDPTPILQFCDRAIYIEKGTIVASGEPSTVLEMYQASQFNKDNERDIVTVDKTGGVSFGNRKATLRRCILLTKNQEEERSQFFIGETAKLFVEYEFHENVDDVCIGIQIKNRIGAVIYGTNSNWKDVRVDIVGRIASVIYEIPVTLFCGSYTITVAASEDRRVPEEMYSWDANVKEFDVVSREKCDFSGEADLSVIIYNARRD